MDIERQSVLDYIRDTSLHLSNRWNIFTHAVNAGILEQSLWLPQFEVLNYVSWYDDFHIRRYTAVSWPDIITSIDEKSWLFLMLDELKEEILSAGYSGFIYDWRDYDL